MLAAGLKEMATIFTPPMYAQLKIWLVPLLYEKGATLAGLLMVLSRRLKGGGGGPAGGFLSVNCNIKSRILSCSDCSSGEEPFGLFHE